MCTHFRMKHRSQIWLLCNAPNATLIMPDLSRRSTCTQRLGLNPDSILTYPHDPMSAAPSRRLHGLQRELQSSRTRLVYCSIQEHSPNPSRPAGLHSTNGSFHFLTLAPSFLSSFFIPVSNNLYQEFCLCADLLTKHILGLCLIKSSLPRALSHTSRAAGTKNCPLLFRLHLEPFF